MNLFLESIVNLFSPPSLSLLLLGLAIYVAQTVQAATGFGGVIIAVALGAHLYPLHILVPVVVTLDMAMNIYLVSRHKKYIDWQVLKKRILPYIGLGLAIGLFLFYLNPVEILELAFAIFIILISIFELIKLFLASRDPNNAIAPIPLKPWAAASWLLAGGIIHGIYASGGPLVVYFASRQLTNKAAFRSTLSMLWLILASILMIGYLSGGRLNIETLSISSSLILPLLLGILTGEFIHSRIREKAFRPVIYTLLIIAGVFLVTT